MHIPRLSTWNAFQTLIPTDPPRTLKRDAVARIACLPTVNLTGIALPRTDFNMPTLTFTGVAWPRTHLSNSDEYLLLQ